MEVLSLGWYNEGMLEQEKEDVVKQYLRAKYQNMPQSPFSGGTDQDETFEDLVNFSIGDPDIRTHELIIEGAFADTMAGMTNYTNPQGMVDVREEVAKFYKDEYAIDVDTSEILITTSGCEAMVLVLSALTGPGDEVIIPSPFFGVYQDQVDYVGATPVFVETRHEENFELSPEALEAAMTEKTKLLILNTPNNPTGACLTKEKMRKIYDICEKHDVLILADDIYTIYSYAEDFVPMMGFEPQERKRVITVNSFSKDFVMTGWRIGSIIAHKDLINVFMNLHSAIIFSTPTVSQRAGLYALRHRHEIQPALTSEFKERMNYAYERLKALPGIEISPPRGTFYLFPKVTGTGLSSEEFTKALLHEAHVRVIDGKNFGPGGDGHVRFAVTLGLHQMKEAFDRIEKMSIFQKGDHQ